MPVKLKFQDRSSRIYFENTVRKLGGPKVTQSLPAKIREEMSRLAEAVRGDLTNPDLMVMVRPDTRTLSLTAFTKIKDSGKGWERYKQVPLPTRLMLLTYM